jgi:hypothetical protein
MRRASGGTRLKINARLPHIAWNGSRQRLVSGEHYTLLFTVAVAIKKALQYTFIINFCMHGIFNYNPVCVNCAVCGTDVEKNKVDAKFSTQEQKKIINELTLVPRYLLY